MARSSCLDAAVTADDRPAPADPSAASAARRRATLAAIFGLAAVGGANAQMGGGGRGHHGGASSDGPTQNRDAKDIHEPAPPRDLMAAFARRLREGVPALALTPAQQPLFGDFAASVHEVGEHNERRLQRILFRSTGNVSAIAPLRSFIGAELDEGEGRQEALSELKVAYDKLDTLLDERQRGVLANLFVAVRSELQAPRER